MSRVLVIDDDQASARMLQLHLRSQGFDTAVAHDAEDGLAQARLARPGLVILDIRMPGRSGLELLPDLKALQPAPHIIMITAFHDMQTTIEAMPKLATVKARQAEERLGVRTTVIPFVDSVENALRAIPAEADAVLVEPAVEGCPGDAELLRHLADVPAVGAQGGENLTGLVVAVLATGTGPTADRLGVRQLDVGGTDYRGLRLDLDHLPQMNADERRYGTQFLCSSAFICGE